MAFKYVKPTREQLLARTEQKAQIIDPAINPKFPVFRPKQGKNCVRYLPPTWEGHKGWPSFDAMMHRNIGADNSSYLCLRRHLREPCPICEEHDALQEEGDTEGAKQLYARKTRIAWILDRNDIEKGPQIWVYGFTYDEDIAHRAVGYKAGNEIIPQDPDEGFDLYFIRGNEKPYPKTTGFEFDRDPTPIDDDPQWQRYFLDFVDKNRIPDVLLYYDYDHIYDVLHARTGRTKSREDEETGRPAHRRPPPDEEQEEEEQEERTTTRRRAPPAGEEREEEPEEQPRARRRAPAEEDPEPQRTTRRRAPPENGDARGNGADTQSQARRAISSLKEEEETRGAAREPDRSTRRRAPPQQEEEDRPTRRRPPPR